MHSRRQPNSVVRAIGLFAALFVSLVVGGAVGMRPGRPLAFARYVTPWVRYPDPSWYAVVYRGGAQLDYTYLWNDLDGAIEHARHADVVFLGSSRMQFALPLHELRAFEKRSRVRAFALALPMGLSSFPLAMIEKFDLRPRIAVVEIAGFFTDRTSRVAESVIEEGWWGGLTRVWEERIAIRVWPLASRILPSFVIRRSPRYLLRSTTHGAWLPVDWPHRHRAATVTYDAMPDPHVVALARRFRDALAARGTALVLTCVPSWGSDCSAAYANALAGELGVTAVTPPVPGLWTSDLIHLCPLSGKRFGRALLRGVSELDGVRAVAADPDLASTRSEAWRPICRGRRADAVRSRSREDPSAKLSPWLGARAPSAVPPSRSCCSSRRRPAPPTTG